MRIGLWQCGSVVRPLSDPHKALQWNPNGGDDCQEFSRDPLFTVTLGLCVLMD